MPIIGDSFHPGDCIVAPGLYACNAGGVHQWVLPAAGGAFPALPQRCQGTRWVLRSEHFPLPAFIPEQPAECRPVDTESSRLR